MNKDAKVWVIIALITLALILWLSRKTVSVVIGAPKEYGPEYAPLVGVGDKMNAALQRICHYQNSTSIAWPLQTACAPSFQGSPLTTDEVVQKLNLN